MSETTTDTAPYVERQPGDAITAEDWNEMQSKIREDIHDTSQAAAEAVTHVESADDSARLEGKDLAALTEEVTRRVLDDVRGRTGYQQLFRVLTAGEKDVLEHGLGTAPLVDLYVLQYFKVVAREDDESRPTWVTFFLHHTQERRMRVTDADGRRIVVDVQPPDGPDEGVPFAALLTRYGVEYTDTSSLDDLVNEFWEKFFAAPNDRFSDDQYAWSPWFERCCKEKQSVRQLKANGDWDDMVFHYRPRKTVGVPENGVMHGNDDSKMLRPEPPNVFVQHLDDNRTALWYEGTPRRSFDQFETGDSGEPVHDSPTDTYDRELKLMVLLKV
ncbi:hypothetical protein GCM10009809_31310 [Isoptericola hypogeus]|uniref:Uncharacterized protein n=1 Tax=Isoptericola hypogeus TaxID=300179 RepID=A0ABN2JQU3_9MICO